MPKCRYSSSLPVIKSNAHQAKQSGGVLGGWHCHLQLYTTDWCLQTFSTHCRCITTAAQQHRYQRYQKRPKLSNAAHGWMGKQWSVQSVSQSLWLWKPHTAIVRRIINKTNQRWLRYVHVLVKWNVRPSLETIKDSKANTWQPDNQRAEERTKNIYEQVHTISCLSSR